MKSRLKRFATVSLLTVLFTSQVGYYFVYTIHQFIIKEEMERELLTQIPESSFEIIVAEDVAGKIEWEEKGKEFYLQGEMYDVAKIRIKNGKTYLYCLNDRKEKQILNELSKTVNGNHNSKQQNNNLKSPLTDLVCMSSEEELCIFSVPSTYSLYNVTPTSLFEEISMPPPKA